MVSWPVSLFASAAERLESADYSHCLRFPYFPFYLNPFHSAFVSSLHGNPQCPAHNPKMSSPSCPPGPLAPSPSLDPQPHGLLVLSFGCHRLPHSWTSLRGAPSVHTSVTFVPSHFTESPSLLTMINSSPQSTQPAPRAFLQKSKLLYPISHLTPLFWFLVGLSIFRVNSDLPYPPCAQGGASCRLPAHLTASLPCGPGNQGTPLDSSFSLKPTGPPIRTFCSPSLPKAESTRLLLPTSPTTAHVSPPEPT